MKRRVRTITFTLDYAFLVLRRYPSERRRKKERFDIIFRAEYLHDLTRHMIHKESVNATLIRLFLLMIEL